MFDGAAASLPFSGFFLKVARINISMVWEYLFWKSQRCGISTFLLFFFK
jgi:hypothetical protein